MVSFKDEISPFKMSLLRGIVAGTRKPRRADSLDDDIYEKENRIEMLEKALEEREIRIQKLGMEIQYRGTHLEGLSAEINGLKEYTMILKKDIHDIATMVKEKVDTFDPDHKGPLSEALGENGSRLAHRLVKSLLMQYENDLKKFREDKKDTNNEIGGENSAADLLASSPGGSKEGEEQKEKESKPKQRKVSQDHEPDLLGAEFPGESEEEKAKYNVQPKNQVSSREGKPLQIGEIRQIFARHCDSELKAAKKRLEVAHNKVASEIYATYQGRIQDFRDKHESEKGGIPGLLKQESQDPSEAYRDIGKERDEYKQKHEIAIVEVKGHEKTIETLKTRYLSKEQEHSRAIDLIRRDWEMELTRAKHQFESNMAIIKESHNKQMEDRDQNIADLKEELDAVREQGLVEPNKLKAQYEATMDTLKRQHAQHIFEMTAIHDEQMARLKKAHAATKEQLVIDFSTLKEQHAAELNMCEQKNAQNVSQLRFAHATEVGALETKHSEALTHLKEQLHSSTWALSTRDIRDSNMLEMELKLLSDNDIKSRFELLKQEVDKLSRLDWKPSPKYWTNEIVEQLSSNQPLLREQILQDSIWTLLHAFVFCSPFKVFGNEEGDALDVQWKAVCGKDDTSPVDDGVYAWPKPNLATERWRYATIADCRNTVRKNIPSEWDRRARLKKGFRDSMDRLKNELAAMLGELTVLNKEDRESIQALDKLTKSAARTWLEFGMQRCRILIVVSGPQLRAEEKVKRLQQGALELVITPVLKRYGNSTGLDPNTETIVGGFEGEKMKISLS